MKKKSCGHKGGKTKMSKTKTSKTYSKKKKK